MYLSREFHELYGKDNKAGIRRAIRAEVPSINELMDAMEGLNGAMQRERGETRELMARLLDCMTATRDAARKLIINKYIVDYEGESKATPHKTSPNWLNFVEKDF